MKNQKKIDYLNQIRNDYLYIKKVLESCKTSKQVKITGQWYDKVTKEKWEFKSSYIKEHWKLSREISAIKNSLWELLNKKYNEL